MSASGRRFTTPDATAVATPVNTEGVVQTLVVPSNGGPGSPVDLVGRVNITAGAGTTAVVVRLRRGTTVAGTLLGTAETDTLAATNSESIPINATDTQTAEIAQQSYVLTVQQTGGTGAGTVNVGHLEAFVQ